MLRFIAKLCRHKPENVVFTQPPSLGSLEVSLGLKVSLGLRLCLGRDIILIGSTGWGEPWS